MPSFNRTRRSFISAASALAPLAVAGRAAAQSAGEQPILAEAPPAEVSAEASPVASPAAPVAPVYPEPGFAYGMQAHLYYQDVPKTLELVRGAEFGWVKQQVRWGAVEVAPGQFDWTQLDGIVGYAALMGIRVLLSVVTAPAW